MSHTTRVARASAPTVDTAWSTSQPTDAASRSVAAGAAPAGAPDTGSGFAGAARFSSPLVAALERVWAAISTHHPDLPPVVIVLGAGSVGHPAGPRFGHFAARRWHPAPPGGSEPTPATNPTTPTAAPAGLVDPAATPAPTTAPDPLAGQTTPTQPVVAGGAGSPGYAEVFIGGEGLARGAVATLGTLLHEAAHALAHARGIQDTSRQGRWHNARFRALAGEVGITVTQDRRLGWSPTTVPETTRRRYATAVGELATAMRLHRVPETTTRAQTNTVAAPPAAVACDCGRRIRLARAVLDAGPITCGLCGGEFTTRDPGTPR